MSEMGLEGVDEFSGDLEKKQNIRKFIGTAGLGLTAAVNAGLTEANSSHILNISTQEQNISQARDNHAIQKGKENLYIVSDGTAYRNELSEGVGGYDTAIHELHIEDGSQKDQQPIDNRIKQVGSALPPEGEGKSKDPEKKKEHPEETDEPKDLAA